MIKRKIKLNDINDIYAFNKAAQKCPADIDLVSGRYVIDAKSIMGIFSMDLSKVIEVHINVWDSEEECHAFLEAISNMIQA